LQNPIPESDVNWLHSRARTYWRTDSDISADFEVLKAVVMKNAVFWDMTPRSPLKVNRRFGGKYRLHLHDGIISPERNQSEENLQAELRNDISPYDGCSDK
jgi:hypothetical protein